MGDSSHCHLVIVVFFGATVGSPVSPLTGKDRENTGGRFKRADRKYHRIWVNASEFAEKGVM